MLTYSQWENTNCNPREEETICFCHLSKMYSISTFWKWLFSFFFYHFSILGSQNTRPVLFCKLFISIETSKYVYDRLYRVIVGGVFWLFSHSQRELAFCPIWLQFAYFVLDTFKKSFELDSDTFCFTGKGFNFSPYYSMWKIPYNFNLLPNYLIWPFRPLFRKSLSTNCMP